ncbi:SIRBL protein, partial [Hylia prasina]|nr:SIRBL protein [Hylia prasina]
QGFSLQQPQAKVSVEAGETLTLNCTTSGIAGAGPVRWLKGWGSGNKTVYDQRGYSLPRVTRAVGESNTDFTIRIRNVQPEDMGTYYCVKFVKSDTGVDEVSHRGSGTEVSVQAPDENQPIRSRDGEGAEGWSRRGSHGPCLCPCRRLCFWQAQGRAGTEPGLMAPCFSPQPDPAPRSSGDTKHQALPLFPVPPSVEVRAEPSPVEVNKTVTFTCHVKEFYPANVSVSWLENGIEMKVVNVSRPSELLRGLFELRSHVEVPATEEKNGSTITCMVVHDAQAPANYSAFLWISNPGQG